MLPELLTPSTTNLSHLFMAKLLKRIVYAPWIHSFPDTFSTPITSETAPHKVMGDHLVDKCSGPLAELSPSASQQH